MANLNVDVNKDGSKSTVLIDGRIDTTTSPALEEKLNNIIVGTDELILDFANVAYISSAGLRVLLSAQKTMNKQGRMILCNVNENVMDIFEVTGFSDILTIN